MMRLTNTVRVDSIDASSYASQDSHVHPVQAFHKPRARNRDVQIEARSAGVTMSARCSVVAAATAAAAGAVLGLGVARAFPLVASLTDAPLPCQMRLFFCWKGDQVHTTRLKTREANVQECNGVKSVYDSTGMMTEREREKKSQTQER